MASYRVVCPNCRKSLNVINDGPCPSCRSQITIPRGGMIQIYRMGNFIGAAAQAGIYINNVPYGHVGNRSTVMIPLEFGSYLLHMTMGMNRRCNDPTITLTPQNPVAYLKMHIRMGAFSNTQVIEPADPATMPPAE